MDDRMRSPAPRLAPLALSLTLIACAAAPGCAKERLQMDPTLAHQAFPDDRMAQIAEVVARGDAAQIKRLAQGVDLNARGDKGVTLLQWAILSESKQGFVELLDLGADAAAPGIDGKTAMHLAATVNDLSFLRVLLERGVSPNLTNPETGRTPLAETAYGEHLEQARLLLHAGANPNAADLMGNTPLHVAAKTGKGRLVLALLDANADPRAVNTQGATFDRYFFMGNENTLSTEARREREEVRAWLTARGVSTAKP